MVAGQIAKESRFGVISWLDGMLKEKEDWGVLKAWFVKADGLSMDWIEEVN